MNIANKIDEIAATQKVRLFDVYALGPFLIYTAFAAKKPLGIWSRRTLLVAGAMTILYNWKKYRTVKSDLEETLKKGWS